MLAAVSLACLALAACGAPEGPPGKQLAASSFVGKPMGEAYQAIGYADEKASPGLGVTTYNMTFAVSTDDSVGQPAEDWTVIVSCYTDAPIPGGPDTPAPRIALGAVPARYVTPQVQQRAQQKAYGQRLTECPGTSDTFTVAG